ncbi:hypothetical protein JCM11251_004479 [Rhodosporidiobolus azoricus]
MPKPRKITNQPFAVTLRQDLERFPLDEEHEEQILDQFGRFAGGTQGFPIRPLTRSPAGSAPPPTVTVLRSQTSSSASPALPSQPPPRQAVNHHLSPSYIYDHSPLPLSRLRPLVHPGIYDLSNPSQLNTICRELDGRKFTNVIVGAGASGLALARRLTEDPENFVCVLEGGPLASDNPHMHVPNMQHRLYNSPLDWGYRSIKQAQLGGRKISWHAGKVVGGTSVLDSGAWDRPSNSDLNALVKLANEGWDWEGLLPYYQRTESFHPPLPASNLDPKTAHDPIFSPRAHGHDGPVQVSYGPYLGKETEGLFDALREEGLKEIDPAAGKRNGVGYCPSAIDPQTQRRTTAESAYLTPIVHRPNLMLITNALATRLLFEHRAEDHLHPATSGSSLSSNLEANEVEFISALNPAESFYARFTGEVLLCAGTFGSPKILEMSGIGDRKILKKAGIDCISDLPGVGENLQDNPSVSLSYKLKPGLHSLNQLETDKAFENETIHLYMHGLGPLTQSPQPILARFKPADFLSPAETADGTYFLKATRPGPGRIGEEQLSVAREEWARGKRGEVEVRAESRYLGGARFDADAGYIGLTASVSHPLSRGSVHITSFDPLAKLRIDPHLLSHPLDSHLLALSARHLHHLCTNPDGVMAQYIDIKAATKESDVPSKPYVEGWDVWAREHCSISNNPTSTCSMLPLEEKGVVDVTLRVYGTSNVRVADISVVPLAIGGSGLATSYMIGEKAADLVIDAAGRRRQNY